MKNSISHLIYKTTGTPGFVGRIKWRRMLKWLEPKEGGRILDVAYGGGELSFKVAERGCEVSGIDVLGSGQNMRSVLQCERGSRARLWL